MTIRRAMATAALCAAGLAPGAMAQEAQDSFGLGELSCREVMIRTGEPRATAIAFLQGYLAGSAGLSALSPEALAGTASGAGSAAGSAGSRWAGAADAADNRLSGARR